MSATIWGVVREGKIVPQTSLPDGLQVQITVPEEVVIPEELQAELDAWSQGNAEALALVEQLSRDADGVIRVGKTRVTLDTVVDAYRDGATVEGIVQQYPSLEPADVHAVIGYWSPPSPGDPETYLVEALEIDPRWFVVTTNRGSSRRGSVGACWPGERARRTTPMLRLAAG